jgi:hypothetical protein
MREKPSSLNRLQHTFINNNRVRAIQSIKLGVTARQKVLHTAQAGTPESNCEQDGAGLAFGRFTRTA